MAAKIKRIGKREKRVEKPDSLLLEKVWAAGGTNALFAELAAWPKKDLRKLLADIELWFAWALQELEAGREVEMFKPENFFSDKLNKKMNRTFDMAGFEIAGISGEIASVAMFYLGK